MELKALVAALARHGITYRVGGGRVIALEAATQTLPSGEVIGADSWIDVTEWNRAQLLAWLGY